ncbi:CamS family sex pheromone protein [Brevibacillus daliensis]|uniref:CamS family sex pheromone protein n=1 Tax=Brevibacillus daliensis TaxID=2892995 RepID=UPI001E31C7AE|nr:CamS family sex pheromone protein [Brevibacillus daliensis]
MIPNKMKLGQLLAVVLSCSLLLSACSWLPSGEKEKGNPVAPEISSILDVDENYFGGPIPYLQNNTRGMLNSGRYIMDFSHLEFGMMEIAQETFSPDDYLFQEGQRISREQVTNWLAWEKKNPEGLNPDKTNKLLVNVLEHNYLHKKDQSLAGMVIGLSLSPVQQDASGEKRLTVDELRAKGQQLAAKIVAKVKADNPQVPIVVALYQVPEPNSTMVPGNFIMTGTVNANESSVSKWQPISEGFFLFPSDKAYKKDPQISLQFDKIIEQAQAVFGEYIGMTGTGRFNNGELTELTITATAEYDSRTAVIQFTQLMAKALEDQFSEKVHINFYVQSIQRPLAIYVRPSDGGKPYIHVYRN